MSQREHIADLESEIEHLSEAAERCRKVSIAAQALIAAGGLVLVVTSVGLFRLGPTALVAAIAAILGGVSLYGSNRRTKDDIMAAIKTKESQRSSVIDQLGLQPVDGRYPSDA
jgi:hypothetical protein